MRNRIRGIVAVAAVATALAGGSTALASTAGAKPGTPAERVSASAKPVSASNPGSAKPSPSPAIARQNQDAMAAAVASELHVSTAQAAAAIQQISAAGHADPSSPAFAEAARSLGVSAQQLAIALRQGKESVGRSRGLPAPKTTLRPV